jgi:hypothetical protein
MVNFQKICCNSGAIPRNAVIRQDFVEIGAFGLISAFDSGRPLESKSYVLFI